MKRFLLILTCIVFVMTLIIACTKKENTDENNISDSITTETKTSEDTKKEEEVTMYNPDMIESNKSISVMAYDPNDDSKKSAVKVEHGSIYGMYMIMNAPFNSVSACIPTWSQTNSKARLSLYKWDGDYFKTIKNDPLATVFYDKLQDCATNNLKFETMPAGSYMITISDVESSAGIWKYPQKISGGYAYMDGIEEACDLQITVNFTMTPKEPFTKCESGYLSLEPVSTPAEYVIPENDILNTRDAMPDTWVAIDGLGRTLSTNEETGDVKQNKFVGMFYWSWHDAQSQGGVPFNNNEFIEQHPEVKNDYNSPLWPKENTVHFWNEPLFGYYSTTDKWVIRKHAEMLADAGVDVVFFDNTNGNFTWRSSYTAIFEVFDEARKDGVKTPKISFLLPFSASDGSKDQLRSIYMDIYRAGKYQDLWFYYDGKPLLMAWYSNLNKKDVIDKEILEFFTFRPGQPTYNHSTQTRNQWGWLSVFPQQIYKPSINSNYVEQMAVGVAQNWSAEVGLTAMNGKNIFGRSYTSKGYDTRENASFYGANFQEQWDYAIEISPELVFVTGWNEWIAGRYDTWGGVENAFPDEFNDEYSRDIEPTKGALKDHYYYQLVENIRKYKGTNSIPKASAKKTIDINSNTDMWADVYPNYIAYIGNTLKRDADGYIGCHYTNDTGRNDITGAKIAHDNDYIYIMVECNSTITPYTDKNWMRIYLDTSDNGLDGWESFDYIINRDNPSDGKVSVDKFTGTGFEVTSAGKGEFTLNGKRLQIKIKKDVLGIEGNSFTINFKISDNVQIDGDIMDFYSSGDVAPGGRFKYQYKSE